MRAAFPICSNGVFTPVKVSCMSCSAVSRTLRSGQQSPGGARRTGVRHHRRDVPRNGHGELRSHAPLAPHARRALPHPQRRPLLPLRSRHAREHPAEIISHPARHSRRAGTFYKYYDRKSWDYDRKSYRSDRISCRSTCAFRPGELSARLPRRYRPPRARTSRGAAPCVAICCGRNKQC